MKRLLVASSALVAISAVCGLTPIAQSVTAAFDAASFKAHQPGDTRQDFSVSPDGSYRLTNGTVRMVIRQAFRMSDFQIADSPSWTESERFDFVARAPARSTLAALPAMLQALLEDRFGLMTHRKTREMPTYRLVTVRERTLGPRIRRTPSEGASACATMRSRGNGAPARPDGLPCGIGIKGGMGGGTITAGDATLPQLLGLLVPLVGRMAIDKTDLQGTFDFKLTWSADATRPQHACSTSSLAGLGPIHHDRDRRRRRFVFEHVDEESLAVPGH